MIREFIDILYLGLFVWEKKSKQRNKSQCSNDLICVSRLGTKMATEYRFSWLECDSSNIISGLNTNSEGCIKLPNLSFSENVNACRAKWANDVIHYTAVLELEEGASIPDLFVALYNNGLPYKLMQCIVYYSISGLCTWTLLCVILCRERWGLVMRSNGQTDSLKTSTQRGFLY